jgi:hypothetical protein
MKSITPYLLKPMHNLSLSQSLVSFVVGNLRAPKSSRFSCLASVSLSAG